MELPNGIPDLGAMAGQARDLSGMGQPQMIPVFPFKRLHEDAVLPTRSHETDAGLDLSSVENVTLKPGERKVIPTGLAMAMPPGACGLVCPRSGLAAKYGITVTNAPGVVDSGYRGELKVILQNCGDEDFEVTKGMRIAQIVVVQHAMNIAVEMEDLPPAPDRGEAGFGSTGV